MKKHLLKGKSHYRFKRFARRAYAMFNSMHKVVSIGVVSGCMLTFAHAKASAGQEQFPLVLDSISEQELDEVVISSTRAGVTLEQAGQLVTVISAQEIERQPAQSVQDLLKSVAGLDVRQRGSNGVLAGISVRGGTFEQTAILLNGANISNPQTAHYSLDLPVNLSDIERIEIIEGPSSILFGASAFSGGINIITKKDAINNAFIRLNGGMHKTGGAEGRAALNVGQTTHSLSLGYNHSSGYAENTDYRLFSSLWQSRWAAGGNSLDLQFGINDKKYGATTFYSPEYPNQYDNTRRYFASLRGESRGKLQFIPQLYWSRHFDTFHLFRPGTDNIPEWYSDPNYHISDVFGFNLNSRYCWDWGVSSFGGEIRNEAIKSSVLGKPVDNPDDNYTFADNRTNISYFVEQTVHAGKWNFSLGLLANYRTAFGKDFSFYPNANLSYWINDHLKAFASWSTATRVPTFTDLYYKGKTHKGNSDVKPEDSSNFEAGLKFRSPKFTAQITGFYFKGKNMIDWVKEKPEDLWESRNFTRLNKWGIELHSCIKLAATQLDFGFVFMDQEKDASGLISNYVLDYLRYKLTAGLSHPIFDNLTANWQFRWQDRQGTYTRYIDATTAEETGYPAFALVDLKLNYKLEKVDIFLTANNLFNVTYYDIGNIPQPGTWIMGGISYTIR